MLAIDTTVLRRLLAGKETFSERAEKYGVSKQAVSGWLSEGRMPPRAIAEILRDLDCSIEDTEALLAPQKEKAAKKKRWVLKVTLEEEN